ncbi:MAG: hypothetical protein KGV43_01090 [Arcobacter sp.]|nr:hypothetical protein [Arcobacter sp.]
MRIKSLFSIGILSLLLNTILNASDLGKHPSDVKWQEIDTPNVKVIFPKGLEKKASRIATIINYINKNHTYSIGEKSKKLDLVLHTNQVISNGFVGLAPYRSEFFGTALQNNNLLGSLDWLDILSLHEYRHALQYANGDRGFTKFLYYFQGEAGWSLGINLAIPSWYFEGDAVVSETVLSQAGRGRTPFFFKELRANLLNDKEYSYMTSENGSYKDMIPDHYRLGYVMNNYVRNTYGTQVMKDVLAYASSYSSILYPFSNAMEKYTGKTPEQIYKESYKELKNQWEDELKNIGLIPTKRITKNQKETVTNYNFPQVLEDGSIVAIKDSYSQIPHLVHIKDGKEEKLCDYGIVPNTFLSYNNGKLTWIQLKQDIRRANRNYTKVVVYDMKTKSKKYITSKSKYFSPQYALNSDKIVVVKANELLQNNLVIIDGKSGKVIKKVANPKNDFLSFPKWSNNDNELIFLAKRNSKLAIMKYDLATQTTSQLTNWTAHTIGSINIGKNNVYFSSSYSGIDNIYSVSTNGDKIIKKISSVKIGAYEPSISLKQKELVMVEYSPMGKYLSKMDLSKNNTDKIFRYIEPKQMSKYNIVTSNKEHNILDKIKDESYEVKAYEGFFNGLRLHSWSLTSDEDSTGLSLSLDNILTDFSANVGALYNSDDKKVNYFGDVIYSKYFVEMGLHAKVENRNIDYFSSPKKIDNYEFDENNYGISFSTPLNWNEGSFLFGFNPKVQYTFHDTYDDKRRQDNLDFGSIDSSFSFFATQMKAKQNIYPLFGLMLNAKHKKSIKEDIKAERTNLEGSVFLPSLLENHGIKLDANWQKDLKNSDFKFIDEFQYSRGYEALPNNEVYKLSLNYTLPLAYPDWGFGGATYFKRIKANLFYDMSEVKYNNISSEQNSYGAELFFDNTLLNTIPLSLGFRQSFLLNDDILNKKGGNKFEFIFQLGF